MGQTVTNTDRTNTIVLRIIVWSIRPSEADFHADQILT